MYASRRNNSRIAISLSTARVYLTSFRTMKNYLQSSGVILLKDQECLVGFCSSSLLDPLTRCSIPDTLRDVHDG